MIPEVLLLVEQIRSRTTQVYNLRTPIPIFFQPRTFETVEGVRDALSPLSISFYSLIQRWEMGRLPLRHRQHIYFGSCRRSIRHRYGRGL